jgi:chromosome segregation ATPase
MQAQVAASAAELEAAEGERTQLRTKLERASAELARAAADAAEQRKLLAAAREALEQAQAAAAAERERFETSALDATPRGAPQTPSGAAAVAKTPQSARVAASGGGGFFGGSAAKRGAATPTSAARPQADEHEAAARLARERLREAELALETQQRMYKAHIADLSAELEGSGVGTDALGAALRETDDELARKEERLRALRADLNDVLAVVKGSAGGGAGGDDGYHDSARY